MVSLWFPYGPPRCTGPGFSGVGAVRDSDVGTMDASQELRARLAALRGQLNQGTVTGEASNLRRIYRLL